MRILFLVGCLLGGSVFAGVPLGTHELFIRSDYHLDEGVLTTDKIGEMEPDLWNPHREVGFLERKTQLSGLKPYRRPLEKTQSSSEASFGVDFDGLLVSTRGLSRPDGGWYSSLEQFGKDLGCPSKPVEGFATKEGTAFALGVANELWSKLLADERGSLEALLKRVDFESEARSLDQGERLFRHWLKGIEGKWIKLSPQWRKKEWAFYLEEATRLKICPTQGRKSGHLRRVPSQWMEPPALSPLTVRQLLARAPAKLWPIKPTKTKGPGAGPEFMSVRTDVLFVGRALTGKFMIDPSARQSVISPAWLEAQGVHPALLVEREILPKHVVWGATPEMLRRSSVQGKLANTIYVDQVRISNLDVKLHEFLLKEADFFTPPDYENACCDGVLGVDFLRLYPVEFQKATPAEVRIWPRANFAVYPVLNPFLSFQRWEEIYLSQEGDVLRGETSRTKPAPIAKELLLEQSYVIDLPHGRLWLPEERGLGEEKTRSIPQPSSKRRATEIK